jgi:Mg-chelatase subunit ChlD
VYRKEVLAYAVLEDVTITRDAVNEGRFQISFKVRSLGKVVYRRTSGNIETEVVDEFRSTGQRDRSWTWLYDPGNDINVSLRYRQGLWRAERTEVFPTSDSADIVVLMDTTGSMSRSIGELKDKCVSFSAQLKKQHLKHRFAVIGFGDTEEGAWLDKHPFTDDPVEFQRHVESLKRFDGGDLPESALDALEQAVDLPFNERSIRRVYLVTDALFHEKTTKTGARAVEIARRLEAKKMLLNIFSSEEFREAYSQLASAPERFQQIEGFGRVLSEGRLLED